MVDTPQNLVTAVLYDPVNRVFYSLANLAAGGAGAAVTIADGGDVAEGAIADAVVAAGAVGTTSAKLRRLTTDVAAGNTALAAINTTLGTPFQAGGVIGALPAGTAIIGKIGIDQTTPGTTNLVAAGGNVASGVTDSGNPVKTGGRYNVTYPTFTDGQRGDVQLDSRGNVCVIPTTVLTDVIDGWPNAQIGLSPANTGHTGYGIPARAGYTFNGASWDKQRGDANGTVAQPHAMTGNRWQYAAASGGITNTTTAVTIAVAGGASVRNYCSALQINAGTLGVGTEIAIRDGAGGTVLWRGFITTSGLNQGFVFNVPLKGTANTLLEFVTLTASVTGAVYANAQGFTGV